MSLTLPVQGACAGGEDLVQFDAPGADASTGKGGASTAGSGGSSSAGSGGGSGTSGTMGTLSSGGSGGGGGNGGGAAGTGSLGTGGLAGSTGVSGAGAQDAGVDASMASCGSAGEFAAPAVAGQGVVVLYKLENSSPVDSSIGFRVQLQNTGASPIALGAVELRYYFTSEAIGPYTTDVFYAGIGGAAVTTRAMFVAIPAVPYADGYLRYTFADDAVLPGGAALELTSAFHRADYQQSFDECNDFSYVASAGDFVASPRVAVFNAGTLVWGAIPRGALDADGSVDSGDAGDRGIEGASDNGPDAADALHQAADDAWIPDALADANPSAEATPSDGESVDVAPNVDGAASADAGPRPADAGATGDAEPTGDASTDGLAGAN